MRQGAATAFLSYCREDSDFALRLAEDLKAAGANVWLDQLDILPGQRWDRAVEDALSGCPSMLVILSPASVNSNNVMDEVPFALEEKKTLIPVMHKDCTVPFRPPALSGDAALTNNHPTPSSQGSSRSISGRSVAGR